MQFILKKLFDDLVDQYDYTVTLLSPDDYISLRTKWNSNYFEPFIPKSWEGGKSELPWHVFSFKLIPHDEGIVAISQFNESHKKKLTIFSSNPKVLPILLEGRSFPLYQEIKSLLSESDLLSDIYISHHNFRWTLVITHESDFGPYFSSFNK